MDLTKLVLTKTLFNWSKNNKKIKLNKRTFTRPDLFYYGKMKT